MYRLIIQLVTAMVSLLSTKIGFSIFLKSSKFDSVQHFFGGGQGLFGSRRRAGRVRRSRRDQSQTSDVPL